jgi:hypothetical protein
MSQLTSMMASDRDEMRSRQLRVITTVDSALITIMGSEFHEWTKYPWPYLPANDILEKSNGAPKHGDRTS